MSARARTGRYGLRSAADDFNIVFQLISLSQTDSFTSCSYHISLYMHVIGIIILFIHYFCLYLVLLDVLYIYTCAVVNYY